MSNLIHAADSIRQLATQYQYMVEAADALTRVGSLENAAKDAQKLIESTREELSIVRNELIDARNELKDAKKKAADLLASAADEKEKALAEATEESERRIADATIKAHSLINDAVANSTAELDDLKKEKATVTKALNTANTKLSESLEANEKATKELEELQAKIEAAKAAVLKLLGDHQ